LEIIVFGRRPVAMLAFERDYPSNAPVEKGAHQVSIIGGSIATVWTITRHPIGGWRVTLSLAKIARPKTLHDRGMRIALTALPIMTARLYTHIAPSGLGI
jgi:hypothetical protein